MTLSGIVDQRDATFVDGSVPRILCHPTFPRPISIYKGHCFFFQCRFCEFKVVSLDPVSTTSDMIWLQLDSRAAYHQCYQSLGGTRPGTVPQSLWMFSSIFKAIIKSCSKEEVVCW